LQYSLLAAKKGFGGWTINGVKGGETVRSVLGRSPSGQRGTVVLATILACAAWFYFTLPAEATWLQDDPLAPELFKKPDPKPQTPASKPKPSETPPERKPATAPVKPPEKLPAKPPVTKPREPQPEHTEPTQRATQPRVSKPEPPPPPPPAAPQALAGFSFLGVDADADLDATRRRQFEDYTLLTERSCIGCFCSHAYGDHLIESHNELYGLCPEFKTVWDKISPCLTPKLNAIPQIRSIALEAEYVDMPYSKVSIFFSEFTKKPLALRLETTDPKALTPLLTKEYGEPENIKNVWQVWRNDEDLLLVDAYNFLFRKHATVRVYVYFMRNFPEHWERLKQRAASTAN
jgi:hypothetical protein